MFDLIIYDDTINLICMNITNKYYLDRNITNSIVCEKSKTNI